MLENDIGEHETANQCNTAHDNAVLQVSNQNSTRNLTTLKNNIKQFNAEQLIGSKHLPMQAKRKTTQYKSR